MMLKFPVSAHKKTHLFDILTLILRKFFILFFEKFILQSDYGLMIIKPDHVAKIFTETK